MNINRNHRAQEKGFTLLELIVVITIIGLLGTLVVTKVAPMLAKGNATKIKYDLKKISEAATFILSDTGSYPESIDEMINAVDDEGNAITGALDKTPKDPWGNPYEYEIRDGKPLVICRGRDANTGGEGDDQDYFEPEQEEY